MKTTENTYSAIKLLRSTAGVTVGNYEYNLDGEAIDGYVDETTEVLSQNKFIPVPSAINPGTDNALGTPLRFFSSGNGVHLRRINEVDSLIKGIVELCMTFGFCILFSKSHRSQANFTYDQVCIS